MHTMSVGEAEVHTRAQAEPPAMACRAAGGRQAAAAGGGAVAAAGAPLAQLGLSDDCM